LPRQPFVPFRFEKTGGTWFTVHNPEMALVSRHDIELAMPIENGRQRFLTIAMVHVNSVEILLPVNGNQDSCVIKGAKTPGADMTRRAERYAARAVELSCRRAGIAKRYDDIDHLKKDDDLKALREREDYEKLLKEMEEKR
jgi:hypothetical protein